MATAFTRISRESRRVIEVLDEAREESTRLSEPAPFITTEELGRFAGEFRKLVPGMDAVVLSGGLAAGLPLDIYASLATYAAEASVPAIIHAGGLALWRSLDRRPALVLIAFTAGGPGAGASDGPGRPAGPGFANAAASCRRGCRRGRPGSRRAGRAVAGRAGGLPGLSAVRGGRGGGAAASRDAGLAWPNALRHAVALGARPTCSARSIWMLTTCFVRGRADPADGSSPG